jgi:SET domain-containing protein
MAEKAVNGGAADAVSRSPEVSNAAAKPKADASRRIQVRRSGVHGKGVYALQPIARGERIVEYTGQLITWKEALRRHPHDPDDPNHTFYFHIDDGRVIDGKYGRNAAKWINHSCQPNCETDEIDGRVYIKARRAIKPGEELNYDYALVLDGRHTAKIKKEFECRCGSRKCRGTLLAPKG